MLHLVKMEELELHLNKLLFTLNIIYNILPNLMYTFILGSLHKINKTTIYSP